MRGHNEGSIKERKDGRFEIRVTAGYDFKTGRSKRISYYANTKAEAVKKLHEEEYNIHFKCWWTAFPYYLMNQFRNVN